MSKLSNINECINDYDLLFHFDFPKVIAHEIILYVYATCSECKKCLLTEYTCELCGRTRCKYHHYMATFSIDIKLCTKENCAIMQSQKKYYMFKNDIIFNCIAY